MEKIFLNADQLLNDSFMLAEKVMASQFMPDLIVGIWRGGTPVAIAVAEAFRYAGCNVEHLPLKTCSYTGIAERKEVEITGLEIVTENLNPNGKLLLIDDVFDTGNSIKAIMDALSDHYGQIPEVRTAVPWYKPSNNQTNVEPDFFIHETDAWLIFPHELQGLEKDELLANKPLQKDVLNFLKKYKYQ